MNKAENPVETFKITEFNKDNNSNNIIFNEKVTENEQEQKSVENRTLPYKKVPKPWLKSPNKASISVFANNDEKDISKLLSSSSALETIHNLKLQSWLEKGFENIEKQKGVIVIICFKTQRKTFDIAAKKLSDLQDMIIANVKSNTGISLKKTDFVMSFYDFDTEWCQIEEQEDLDGAYDLTLRASPPHLKLCLDIGRNI